MCSRTLPSITVFDASTARARFSIGSSPLAAMRASVSPVDVARIAWFVELHILAPSLYQFTDHTLLDTDNIGQKPIHIPVLVRLNLPVSHIWETRSGPISMAFAGLPVVVRRKSELPQRKVLFKRQSCGSR